MTSDLTRPLERHRWALLPVQLAAFGYGIFCVLSVLVQVVVGAGPQNSDVTLALQPETPRTLPGASGSNSYSGGAYIADGARVTATAVQATVSGIGFPTRVALWAGPLLWTVSLAVVALAVALVVQRLRVDAGSRYSSRPMVVAAIALAIGSTAAQLVTLAGRIGVGHVMWHGADGMDGFSAFPPGAFDLTPLVVSAAFLAIGLLLSRLRGLVPSAAS